MSVQKIVTAPTNSSDALFRLWGKGLSDAMELVGFTKTADTGQIDWTTVAAPVAGSTYQGYEIRQFTDAIQSTVPILVKLEYGSNTTTGGVGVCIRITVGSASDGGGTLTGDVSAYFYITSGNSTTPLTSYISSDGGRINLALWVSNTNYCCAFWIERLKDSNGAATDDGVHIFSATQANSRNYTYTATQFLPPSGAAYPAAVSRATSALQNLGATYNENIGLFPIYPNLGYAGNPDLGGLMFNAAELGTAGSFMTVSMYGSNHVFMIMGFTAINPNSNAAANLLVRCE